MSLNDSDREFSANLTPIVNLIPGIRPAEQVRPESETEELKRPKRGFCEFLRRHRQLQMFRTGYLFGKEVQD